MRRVDHHDVGRWDRRQHPPTSGLTLSRTDLSLELGVPFRLAVLALQLVTGHAQVGPVAEPLERHIEQRQPEEQHQQQAQPARHQRHGLAGGTGQTARVGKGRKGGKTVAHIPAADGPQQTGQQRQLQELDQVAQREDALEAPHRVEPGGFDAQRLEGEVETARNGAGRNGGRTDGEENDQHPPAQRTEVGQHRLQGIQKMRPYLPVEGKGAGHQPARACGQRRPHHHQRADARSHHQQMGGIPRTRDVTLLARLLQALLGGR